MTHQPTPNLVYCDATSMTDVAIELYAMSMTLSLWHNRREDLFRHAPEALHLILKYEPDITLFATETFQEWDAQRSQARVSTYQCLNETDLQLKRQISLRAVHKFMWFIGPLLVVLADTKDEQSKIREAAFDRLVELTSTRFSDLFLGGCMASVLHMLFFDDPERKKLKIYAISGGLPALVYYWVCVLLMSNKESA